MSIASCTAAAVINTANVHLPDAWQGNILTTVHHAMRTHGGRRVMLRDEAGAAISYRQLITRVILLSELLGDTLGDERHIGVLLPTAPGAAVTYLTLLHRQRIPAMLNFTAGNRAVLAACATAQLSHVLTSKVFIAKAGLEPLVEALRGAGITLIYLEDFRKQATLFKKITALLRSYCFSPPETAGSDPAAILFTSGSEGAPKGVALSHTNILTNIAQAAAHFDFTDKDSMFNCLPIFHSFGLTVGTLLPLVLGMPVFTHPSPLQYKTIPPLLRKSGASIFLTTDTFINGYARSAETGDFAAVRLCVAGAEKLREDTRSRVQEQFGLTIYQGYGVTECSPVISANTPDYHRPGTIGRLMPGVEAKLEPVEGISLGGRLWVRGGNVMLGYIRAQNPGVIEPQGEWYDTGDLAVEEEGGYWRLLGRAKRFAKLGGEMVSLSIGEELALSLFPDAGHAAFAAEDPRKGERIILLSEAEGLTREALLSKAQAQGVAEIALPREVVHVAAIPRLGSGKIDYPALPGLYQH